MSINPFALPPDPDEDLFGEQEEHAPTTTRQTSLSAGDDHTGLTDEEDENLKLRRKLEYGEEDEEPPEIPEGMKETIDVSLPTFGLPRSSDGNAWLMRLPQYLHVDSRPFHPDTYQPLENRESTPGSSAQDKSLGIKLEVMNTIRWRWVENERGEKVRQSNARVIKWDDGSMSLQLGNEMYDISATNDNVLPSAPSSQSQSQSQGGVSQRQGAGQIRQSGPSYLVSQHAAQGMLQAQSLLTGTFSLRPISTHSSSHQALVKAVAQRHNKVSRLRFADDAMLASAANSAENLKKKGVKRVGVVGDGTRKRRARGEVQDGDTPSRRRRGGYSDDSGSADEGLNLGRGKAGAEYMEDDFLVADSDEGDGFGSPAKKRKTAKHSSDDEEDGGELDPLEEAEERIKRAGKGPRDSMDLDDDDDEEAARRTSSKRRKMAAMIDSDDE